MSHSENEAVNEQGTDPLAERAAEPVVQETGGSTPAHPPSRLDVVREKIGEARHAEDHLEHVMPAAIQPDDDAYEGVTGPTEGDVEETDDHAKTRDERDAESPRQPVSQQVQEEVIGDGTGQDGADIDRS